MDSKYSRRCLAQKVSLMLPVLTSSSLEEHNFIAKSFSAPLVMQHL